MMRSRFASLPLSALACLAIAFLSPPSAAQRAEETAISRDGVAIHYEVQGQGEPALVFVHCWGCNRQYWDAQAGRFSKTHRVVTLDLAGHGASGLGRKDWTIRAFAEDVLAVLEKLDIRKAVLIGHSMGGPVILEAARRIPGRIAALVFVDTVQNPEQGMDPKTKAEMLSDLRADFPKAVGKFMRQNMFAASADPKLVDEIVNTAAAMPPDAGIASIKGAVEYDPRPALAEIKAPIRAINADKQPTDLDALRRHAPQFDAVIMKGVGHYPMREDPERFNQLLEGVLKSLD